MKLPVVIWLSCWGSDYEYDSNGPGNGNKTGNPIRKLVLIKLADNANDNGECWPSYQHIADHCECSRSAVRTHIDALIGMGVLTKENRMGINNGKGNTSNVYYLNLDTPMPPKAQPLCRQKSQVCR